MERWEKWRPDTCECVIEEKYLDNVLTDERRYVAKCARHMNSEDPTQDVLVKENQKKNFLEGHLLESLPDHVDIVLSDDGSLTKQWKKGVKFDYSFDSKGDISIDIKGTIPVDKVALEATAQELYPEVKAK